MARDPTPAMQMAANPPGPRSGAVGTRRLTVVPEHPLPAARLHPQSQRGSPELGGTPKPPPQGVQAHFHPQIVVLNSFRLPLPLLSRIIDMEGIKENLSVSACS